MQDINNINLDTMIDKENNINKEIDLIPDLFEKKINNSKTIKDNNLISEHKKCVPLQIYQKVYLDKQKLISEINNLNNEINNLNKNNNKQSLENEIKDLQRNLKNYENALIKQEKIITILKSRISKLEKVIIKKEFFIRQTDGQITD